MCDCIEETFNKIKAVLIEKLPNGVVDNTLSFEMDGHVFRFDGSNNCLPAMKVNYEYKIIKRDGTVPKNCKKDNISVFGSHCPFCGIPHETAKQK